MGARQVARHRQRFLVICMGATSIIGLSFGSIDLWQGNRLTGGMEIFVGLMVAALLLALPRVRNPAPIFHFYGVFISLFLGWELAGGGSGGHVFLWLLLMPQIFFSIFGTATGKLYSLALLLLVAGVHGWVGHELYEAREAIRFFAIYIVMAIVGYFLESTREIAARRQEEESLKLAEALEHAETLRGLMRLCPICARVRDDDGYWTQVEGYILERVGTRWSHGLCPPCSASAMKDLGKTLPKSD